MQKLPYPNIDEVFGGFHPNILAQFSQDYQDEVVEIIALIGECIETTHTIVQNDAEYDYKNKITLFSLHLMAYQMDDENINQTGCINFLINHFLFADCLFYFGEHKYYHLKVKKHKTNINEFLLVHIDEYCQQGSYSFLDKVIENDTITQATFDNMTFNWNDNLFQTNILWKSHFLEIELATLVPSKYLFNKLLQSLKIVLSNLDEWDKKVKSLALKELYDEYFEWAEDDKGLTQDEFVGVMNLFSLSIYKDGEFALSYVMGDVFGGSYVYVKIANGEIADLCLN